MRSATLFAQSIATSDSPVLDYNGHSLFRRYRTSLGPPSYSNRKETVNFLVGRKRLPLPPPQLRSIEVTFDTADGDGSNPSLFPLLRLLTSLHCPLFSDSRFSDQIKSVFIAQFAFLLPYFVGVETITPKTTFLFCHHTRIYPSSWKLTYKKKTLNNDGLWFFFIVLFQCLVQ